MQLVIIADDLTGALDSAVAFAARGLRTICARALADLPSVLGMGAQVVAVSTGSREVSQTQAIDRITALRATLQAHPGARNAVWFKKIDSRLKGHAGAEISALTRPGQALVICPAIPRLGRYTDAGQVMGSGVTQPIDIAATLGVQADQVIDAKTDFDLDTGLSAAPDGALFVGAAGLAEALSRQLVPAIVPAQLPHLPAPALIAIGSRDPVTLAQLRGLSILSAPNGAVPITAAGAPQYTLVQLTPGATEIPPELASDRFADGLVARLQADPPATLIASGGETAAAIMQKLAIGQLEVLGEVLPGLPVSRALDGWPGLTIVTKSGGFGAADTLVKLVRKLVKSQ